MRDGQAQEVYAAGYEYAAATGRMNRVTGPGLPAYGVTYDYTANSDLVGSTQFMVAPSPSTPAVTVTRTYDPQRPLLASVQNDKTAGTISRYAYQYDAVGRRTSVLTTGDVFGAGAYNLWGYNTRSELTSSKRYTGSQVPVPPNLPDPEVTDQRRLYTYDTIGNRKDRTTGTGAALYYCANNLNQYVTTDELATCPAQPPATESFTHDADGNLTQDGRYTYTWDAENRLTSAAPTTPIAGDKKLEMAYDYLGRRVRKLVYNYSGGWQLQSDRRFVWDGWNLLMFLDGQSSNAIVRKQVWGLDLAGQSGGAGILPASGIHGAGGIGGLLACVETQGTFWYLYDGNGNVGQVLSAGTYNVVAHYEYDPYGNAIVAAGPYATANPYRFSTKQWDTNVGLGYWGYRYYSPTTGRWLSRDPIGEAGGAHLYAYVTNRVVSTHDSFGLRCTDKCSLVQPPKKCKDDYQLFPFCKCILDCRIEQCTRDETECIEDFLGAEVLQLVSCHVACRFVGPGYVICTVACDAAVTIINIIGAGECIAIGNRCGKSAAAAFATCSRPK